LSKTRKPYSPGHDIARLFEKEVDIPLSGVRVLSEGKTRLFEPMLKLLFIADALAVALLVLHRGKVNLDAEKDHATATCKQFPIILRYPVLKPTLSILHEEPLTEITFSFTPLDPPALPPTAGKRKLKGVGRSLLGAVSPVFVDFYEKHRSWMTATFGKHPDWPPLFRFAWMLRNFISHTEGRVRFNDPNIAPVTWHQLSYSPADNGRQVIGVDIDIADLVVLMFELSDELDRRGCPLNP
jgi:hypothetical protein